MRILKHLLFLQAFMLSILGAGTTTALADTPFIGEVRWFAGTFAPRGWALCNGQLLPIDQNPALFSILGTTYGGDGEVTFALPDLRGRGMVHAGNGIGLSNRPLGGASGTEVVTLTTSQIPGHAHTLRADPSGGDSVLPNDRVISKVGRLRVFDNSANDSMDATSIFAAGGGQPHNNMQPNIALNCIISLEGWFPSRN